MDYQKYYSAYKSLTLTDSHIKSMDTNCQIIL